MRQGVTVQRGVPVPMDIQAAADYLGPGAIEINRYQTEIVDLVRRRLPFGQRIDQTPATGQPSRFFEQTAIPTAAAVDPRILSATATQPTRRENVVTLKAITSQINYGIFDVEVNQQQGQFAYLEAKDLTDTVDGVLKYHDQRLWDGADTDLLVTTSFQYFGVSGQILGAVGTTNPVPGIGLQTISSTGSIVDGVKTTVALMVNRTDFEVKPTALYTSPLLLNLTDIEVKSLQLYYNTVEIIPGVIVNAIPTQMGILPLIGDPAITTAAVAAGTSYTGFIVSEDLIQYHYLTDALPRVFQLGLLANLAAQYVVVKFGGVVVKGAPYAHAVFRTTR